MATKNDSFFLKNKQKSGANYISHNGDGQYSNLDLNQKCPSLFPVQSYSKSFKDKHYDSEVSDKYKEKGTLKALNKYSDLCSGTSKFNVEEKDEKQWKKNDTSNSVLSLHIAAFENSVENVTASETIKKWGNKKEIFNALSKFVIQNPFEFPRQQNDNKVLEPELSHFRASQRLFNPNEALTNDQQNVSVSQQQPITDLAQQQQQHQIPALVLQQPLSSVAETQRSPLRQATNFNAEEKKMGCCKTKSSCCCCCPNFPGRIFAWLIAFFIWYQIFIGVHIGLVSDLGAIFHTVIIIFWNGIFLLTISSLFSAALTEPSSIDPKYKVPEEFFEVSTSDRTISFHRRLSQYAQDHPELSFQLVDVGDFKYPRYCDHCQVFKPPRTHHCRTCKLCIPRMDHHCPVIGKCVHFHNHKFFLLFLFWASMLCLFATAFISPACVYLINLSGEPRHGALVEVIPAMIVTSGLTNAIVCGLALFCFQMYLWWMLKNNETTLESHEDDDDDKPNYDLGAACENIQSIFGKKWILWFLPIPTTPGDGLTFVEKVRTENDFEE